MAVTGESLWAWALTPIVAFPVLWVCGVLLAQVHVLSIQSNWSITVWLVMAEVPIAFLTGGLAARRWAAARPAHPVIERPELDLPLRWLAGLVFIGALGLAYEFVQARSIPLFAPHVDSARVALNGGASALLTDALSLSGAAALAIPRRLLAREAAPALVIAAASVGGMALAGGRGTVVLPIAAGLLARWLYWRRPPVGAVFLAAVLLGGFVSLLFYVRTSQNPPTQAFPAELYGSVVPRTPPSLVPLLPLHFAIAMNFEAFARIIDFFPSGMPYGHGVYDAYALHAILPGRSLGPVSVGLSAPWLASTAAGPLWADGGPVVVAVGMLLFGALTTAPHALFAHSRRFSHALVAGYFLYLALFGLYTSLITQYKDWVLVTAGLLCVGWASEGEGLQRARAITEAVRHPVSAFRQTLRRSRAPIAAQRPPRRPLVRFGAMGLLVLLLGAAIISASDRGVQRQRLTAIGASEHVSLGRVRFDPSDTMITDSDLHGDESPLWTVSSVRGGLRLTRYTRTGTLTYTPVTRTFRVHITPSTQYAMARRMTAVDRLYLIDSTGRTVTVRVLDPAGSGLPMLVGQTTIAPPDFGAVRTFFMAHWSGTSPDLFVVDHGSSLARVAVRIYGGDTGLARRVLAVTTQIRGPDPRNWVLQLARIDAKPDLVLVARRAPDGFSEVHVLTGEANFQRFTNQTRVAIPRSQVGADTLIVGNSLGAPSLMAVGPPGDRVDVYPLVRPAPSL